MSELQKRITYQGDLNQLYEQVCQDYELGKYISGKEIAIGYEDFNVILTTSNGKYCIKFFSTDRTKEECLRYLESVQKVLAAGVRHPALFTSSQGYLHEITMGGKTVLLSVFEYIDGHSFYELGAQPTETELLFLAKQAAVINQIDHKPTPIYDEWACINFIQQFEEKKQYLNSEDMQLVAPLAQKCSQFDFKTLPHAFVHGDIIRTNVMRDASGNIYVLDFSVSNWYPRVQELAVLSCDLFFDHTNPSAFPSMYRKALETYQGVLPLTKQELDILPTYTQIAHAVHIVCPTFEHEVNHNHTKENDFWLELGRKGLKYSLDLWGL